VLVAYGYKVIVKIDNQLPASLLAFGSRVHLPKPLIPLRYELFAPLPKYTF
jgi:hypothetical protein